jgi:hypothetical protein
LPWLSRAEQCTTLAPGGKTLPLGGSQVTTALLPQRVAPVGLNTTTVPASFVLFTMTFVGHSSVRQSGGTLSPVV